MRSFGRWILHKGVINVKAPFASILYRRWLGNLSVITYATQSHADYLLSVAAGTVTRHFSGPAGAGL